MCVGVCSEVGRGGRENLLGQERLFHATSHREKERVKEGEKREGGRDRVKSRSSSSEPLRGKCPAPSSSVVTTFIKSTSVSVAHLEQWSLVSLQLHRSTYQLNHQCD